MNEEHEALPDEKISDINQAFRQMAIVADRDLYVSISLNER